MQLKKRVLQAFINKYGSAGGAGIAYAPGRVNLIGEHTDYNGGHVFPCAVNMGTYVVGRKRNDRVLRFYSDNMADEGVITSSLDDLRPLSDSGWTAYVKAVIWAMIDEGYKIDLGIDIAVAGDIPAGSGLSSSASLEVATAELLCGLFGIDISKPETALIAQKAENEYVGMNCGIMDQFASAMGRKDHAILLNTVNLEYSYVPISLDGKKIVITNTNVKHELASSAYNDRRRECEETLAILKEECNKRGRDINSLGCLTEAEFEELCPALTDDVLMRRARHAVTENQRTLKAVDALKAGDLHEFGRLMYESHASLRYDYEVTCKELDILVEIAQDIKGVYGSRMTGGGFGGCTVSIVDEEATDSFCEITKSEYFKATNKEPSFYIIKIGDGSFFSHELE